MSYNGFNSSENYNQPTQSTGYPNLDNIFNPGNINQNLPRINKNYQIVTSLQEALAAKSPPNSRGVYVHQDGEYEFEIFTDLEGRKTYKIFKRVNCTNEKDAMSIAKDEYEELKLKILKLEEVVYGKQQSASDTANGDATL